MSAKFLQPCSLQPHGMESARLLCPWDYPSKNTGMGCHFLLWGIFPTQGLNLCLLHCRLILYHLGSPGWMELALFGGWMDCAQGVAEHGWSLSTHSVISYSGQGVPDLFQWTVVSFHQVSLTPSACRRERAKKEMCKSHHPSTGESWLL